MTDAVDSLERSMARLAQAIVQATSNAELHDKLEAMKVLTPYYLATKKFPGKSNKKTEDDLSFADFAEDLGQLNGKELS